MSSQLSYASTGLVNFRASGMNTTAADAARVANVRIQHSWQTLVLRCEFPSSDVRSSDSPRNATSRSDAITYARFDASHKAVPSPWMLAQWSEDFGWHRSLQETADVGPIGATKDSIHKPVVTQFDLRNQGTKHHAESASNASGSPTTEQARLSQMLVEAAHDIRSPIAVAQQIIAILSQRAHLDAPFTAAETGLLDEAQLRLTQANSWAEGILIQKSLADGQPVNVRRRFYPLQWLRGIQPLLNSMAIQHGVRLAWIGWDRSLPRLYLDAHHLSRAVMNLVSNAIHASRPGSQVSVQVSWQTHLTQRLVITIEDQGSGLSAELLQQINAGDVAIHEKSLAASAGVGLKTATTLVRGLGGSITAQARAVGGTRFLLTVPVDNYHSLVHSWLQQNGIGAAVPAPLSRPRITIHALRSSAGEDAKSIWQAIDARLQQAANVNEMVYRVSADRWLWLSLQPTTSPSAIPQTLSQVLIDLRERDNAWNRALDCRQQLVFQWQPPLKNSAQDICDRGERGHVQLMHLTSLLAEKIAEFAGDHVPPLDELQTTDTPIIIRPSAGGPARMIRSDRAQAARIPAHIGRLPTSASSKVSSLADTPCESFSGSLAELAEQWHVRQQRLDQASSALYSR